jgi:hypothetical protein
MVVASVCGKGRRAIRTTVALGKQLSSI